MVASRTGRGWLACSLASSLLLFLAMPGYVEWWPLLFLALVPLLHVPLVHRPFRAGLAGFVFGLAHALLTVHWIVVVLGRYGGLPLWASVLVLLLLAMYMAIYPALFCGMLAFVAGRYWHRERSIASLVWMAPFLWVGLEYVREQALTGFPWLDLGYGLYSQPMLIQAADLAGHRLLSFALVLGNSLLIALIDRQRSAVRWNLRLERMSLQLACSLFIFIFGYSMLRYRVMPAMAHRALQAGVAVAQGNIAQDAKWRPDRKQETVSTYLQLSRKVTANAPVELVVWPETALPFFAQRDPLVGKVKEFVRSGNVYLLTGAPTFRVMTNRSGENHGPRRRVKYYNSGILFSPDGGIAGIYSKQHLVPFGEYVPLRHYLGFLSPLVETVGDFSPGTSNRPLAIGEHLRLGVLICFESIFPEIARDQVARGANLLVNLTNDAWYGRSSAPYQSMAMAVLRAVETKRSLVRAANTGISGFIDPAGHVYAATEIFTRTVIEARVPVFERNTVFVRTGYRFGLGCLVFSCVSILLRQRSYS